MTDTQYKSKTLIGLDPAYPAIGGLAPNTLARWSPLGGIERAQDTVPASSRRVVVDWSISGATDWAQPNGSVDPGTGAQNYPDATLWRRVGTYRATVTPGCELRARVLYCPAGLAQKNIVPFGWISAGAWAKLRIGTVWTVGASTTGPHYREMTMAGSTDGTWGGLEAGGVGGRNWSDLRIKDIVDIRPPTFTSDASVASTYSEWSSVEIRIDVRGGARVLQVVIYEWPLAHVQLHNNASLKSVHATPASLAPQTPLPMVKPPNGATYQENRFGTTQVQQVTERQSERIGPRVASLASWRESDASIYLASEGNPWTTSSSSFVDVNGGSATYNRSDPGWLVAGGHAKLHRLCEPRLIMRAGVAAVVPVRVRVDASQALGTGTVRVQSGDYEWVDVPITGARAWYSVTGYLESQVYGDHAWAVLRVFLRSTGIATLSVYGVDVDFGQWTL